MAAPRPPMHARDHGHGGADPALLAWEDVGTGGGPLFVTPILDSFNRADSSPIGPPWEARESKPLRLTGNQLTGSASGNNDYYGVFKGAGPFAGSCEAYMTVATVDPSDATTGASCAVFLYAQDDPTSADLRAYGVHYRPNHKFSGSHTILLTGIDVPADQEYVDGYPLLAGDKLGVRVVGDWVGGWVWRAGTWTMMVEGPSAGTLPATGWLAVRVDGDAYRIDSFGGGTV